MFEEIYRELQKMELLSINIMFAEVYGTLLQRIITENHSKICTSCYSANQNLSCSPANIVRQQGGCPLFFADAEDAWETFMQKLDASNINRDAILRWFKDFQSIYVCITKMSMYIASWMESNFP